MGDAIYYDKKFIKLPNGIIPVVQMGASNSFQYYRGRKVREKNWMLFSFKGKLLHSQEDIDELKEAYAKMRGHKNRTTQFKSGEFSNWLSSGARNAATVEEYSKAGYTITFVAETNPMRFERVNSSEKLQELVNNVELTRMFGEDSVVYNVIFDQREVKNPNRKRVVRKRREPELVKHYYVIWCLEVNGYLVRKMNKGGYKYCTQFSMARKYKSMKEAKRYIEKYGIEDKFEVNKINEGTYI